MVTGHTAGEVAKGKFAPILNQFMILNFKRIISGFKRTYGHTYIAWINKIGAEGCCSVNSNMKCEQQQQGRQVHD